MLGRKMLTLFPEPTRPAYEAYMPRTHGRQNTYITQAFDEMSRVVGHARATRQMIAAHLYTTV